MIMHFMFYHLKERDITEGLFILCIALGCKLRVLPLIVDKGCVRTAGKSDLFFISDPTNRPHVYLQVIGLSFQFSHLCI